mgnify:CR=1 FL=1
MPLQSRFSSDATNSTDVPDLSTFAYRPTTASAHSYQGKITSKATDAAAGPPDLRTFAYAPTRSTTSRFDQSENTRKAMCTADSPPDISTFEYKPMKSAVRRSDGSKFSGAALKAARRTSRS